MDTKIAAYIAGFFDGDGSVRIQIQPRENVKLGFRVRAIISFAQKTGHEEGLRWIRNQLGIGYLYNRNDGMSELKIEGFAQVESILIKLFPFVHFKEKQVGLALKALRVIKKNPKAILKVARITDKISELNYVTVRKKYTSKVIEQYLKSREYTPVTTDPNLKK